MTLRLTVADCITLARGGEEIKRILQRLHILVLGLTDVFTVATVLPLKNDIITEDISSTSCVYLRVKQHFNSNEEKRIKTGTNEGCCFGSACRCGCCPQRGGGGRRERNSLHISPGGDLTYRAAPPPRTQLD